MNVGLLPSVAVVVAVSLLMMLMMMTLMMKAMKTTLIVSRRQSAREQPDDVHVDARPTAPTTPAHHSILVPARCTRIFVSTRDNICEDSRVQTGRHTCIYQPATVSRVCSRIPGSYRVRVSFWLYVAR